MHYQTTIEYGDDTLFSMGFSRGEFVEEACFLLAAKLCELGRLTSGQAAQRGRGRVPKVPFYDARMQDPTAETSPESL
jgi:hypothetical protein